MGDAQLKMVTPLGDAKVRVTLDVAEAKRQLQELRSAVRSGSGESGGQGAGASPADMRVLPRRPQGTGGGHPNVSGDIDFADVELAAPGWSNPFEEGWSNPFERGARLHHQIRKMVRRDARRALASQRVAEAIKENSLAFRAKEWMSGKVGLEMEQMATLKGVALTKAAVWSTVSVGTKLAPYAIEAAKQMLPEQLRDSQSVQQLQTALADLKAVVNNIESRITNYAKAAAETTELWGEGMRSTGQMPDFVYYFNQNYDTGVAQSDLSKKFDHFKRMQIATAVGKSMGEVFGQTVGR